MNAANICAEHYWDPDCHTVWHITNKLHLSAFVVGIICECIIVVRFLM